MASPPRIVLESSTRGVPIPGAESGPAMSSSCSSSSLELPKILASSSSSDSPSSSFESSSTTIIEISAATDTSAITPTCSSPHLLDDLSVDRWLMRVMRLGGGGRNSTGSAGYGQSATSTAVPPAYLRSRRKSAVESLCLSQSGSSGAFLRPPSNRARRLSESLGLMPAVLSGAARPGSRSRRGSLFLCDPSSLHHPAQHPGTALSASNSNSNLVRMRNSNLGQSAPSLSSPGTVGTR